MADERSVDDGGPTVVWRDLLHETEALLGDRRHARWVCERAASATPDEFVTMLDAPATGRMVAHLDEMVARARAGEPIQYVLGSWQFRGLDLAIDQRVLIPRPETEAVAGVAIELARQVEGTRTVVDLGTGSGAIGLAMADELPLAGTAVWLTDRSGEALAVARANLAGLGRAARNVRIAQGSWYDALPDGVVFDVIVANPPYVADGDPALDASVLEWEPSEALLAGRDGLDDLRRIVAGAPERLEPGGWLVVEHGHEQGEAVAELMVAAGLVEAATERDAARLPRYTRGRRPEPTRPGPVS